MTITDETKAELSLSSRLRAAACGIAEGNVADPHGHRVGLMRQAADALAAAEAERDRLRAEMKAARSAAFAEALTAVRAESCATCRASGEWDECLRTALGDTPCP